MGRAALAVMVLCACTPQGSGSTFDAASVDAPSASGCNAANCGGCCNGDVCEPGDTDQWCGAGGNACMSCTSGCVSHACASPAPMLGKDWMRITSSAPFGAIGTPVVAEFAGEMWIMGASGNTVWHSPDGTSWTAEAGSPPFTPVCAVAWQSKLWAFSNTKTLWTSPDGASWTQVTVNAGAFGARNATASCFVFDNELWISGGSNTLYASPDGGTWTQVSALDDPYAIVLPYHGALWQFGGATAGSYVKTSPDGATWTPVNLSAPFRGTIYGRGAVTDDKMWLVVLGSGTGDAVWSTTTGLDFVDDQPSAPFGADEYFGLSTFDPTGTTPHLWILGGERVSTLAEVWESP